MEPAAPTLQSGADIGQALRAIREFRGLTQEDVARLTRVRRVHIAAIETMQLDQLPSRPFIIGYIRAYADVLGLDADSAAERFKTDEPVLDEPLRAPVGVPDGRDPRVISLVVGLFIVLGAIILWNIAQRAMTAAAPPSPTAPAAAVAKVQAAGKGGPFELGAPLPAPVESTTPPAYETPGLANAQIYEDGVIRLEGLPRAMDHIEDTPVDVGALAPTFVKEGAIYGAPADQPSAVTIKALKPSSLIVRGPDGSVYFARQLAEGEAYRAPTLAGVTLAVSTPQAFQVFVGGQSKGVLPGLQVSVSALAGG